MPAPVVMPHSNTITQSTVMPIPITLAYPADQVQPNIRAASTTPSEPPSPSPVANPATPILQHKPTRRTTPRNPNGWSMIPIEIYLQIVTATLLPISDLVTLLRVSRLFHFITCPILYPLIYTSMEVYLDLNSNLTHSQGVRFNLRTPPVPVISRVLERTTDGDGVPRETREVILKTPLPNRFEHTNYLTLNQHNASECLSLTPLIMPNVQTLSIRPASPGGQLSLCRTDLGDNCCPLIADLRPRQLIIGGTSTGFTGFTSGLWANPLFSFLPPFVKHLVFIIGIHAGVNYKTGVASSLLENLPGTLEKVSIVVSPAEKGRWALGREMRELVPGSDTVTEWEDRRLEARMMMRAAWGKVEIVEVVGLEVIEDAAMQTNLIDDVDLQGYMRSELKTAMLARGHNRCQAESRSKSIIFTREEDFLPYNATGQSGAQWEEWNEELLEILAGMTGAIAVARASKIVEV